MWLQLSLPPAARTHWTTIRTESRQSHDIIPCWCCIYKHTMGLFLVRQIGCPLLNDFPGVCWSIEWGISLQSFMAIFNRMLYQNSLNAWSVVGSTFWLAFGPVTIHYIYSTATTQTYVLLHTSHLTLRVMATISSYIEDHQHIFFPVTHLQPLYHFLYVRLIRILLFKLRNYCVCVCVCVWGCKEMNGGQICLTLKKEILIKVVNN